MFSKSVSCNLDIYRIQSALMTAHDHDALMPGGRVFGVRYIFHCMAGYAPGRRNVFATRDLSN